MDYSDELSNGSWLHSTPSSSGMGSGGSSDAHSDSDDFSSPGSQDGADFAAGWGEE